MNGMNLNEPLNEIKNIMTHGHGLEQITDDLINELSNEYGMPKKDLKVLQLQGAQYCRARNSFFFPTENS